MDDYSGQSIPIVSTGVYINKVSSNKNKRRERFRGISLKKSGNNEWTIVKQRIGDMNIEVVKL